MAASSLVTNSRKRPRGPQASAADDFCLNHFDNGLHSSSNNHQRGSEIHHLCSREVSMHVFSARHCVTENDETRDLGQASDTKSLESSPVWCVTDHADSSTGSSCCSSLPGYESSLTGQQRLYCMSAEEDEAESFCGGASEVDIACFLDDEVCDDANNECFSFNPETIFLNEAGSADCSAEEGPFVGCSAENGGWFLNDLDSQGQAFLNEVLDQEWMAAAVANLEKLNDTLSADSCVLHLLEADHSGKDY